MAWRWPTPLPPALLVAITIVSSLTSILSHTGMRSLLPMIVPEYLWERVNAIDSNGYVVATILGPPIAATLVTVVGGPIALIIIGTTFGLAAVALIGAPDPPSLSDSTGRLLRDAWDGVKYTWANPTLRGLGFSISALNIAGGMITIVIPLIVLERLHAGEALVGLIFAISGVTGMVSAFWFGRQDTRGREWGLLVIPMLLVGPTPGDPAGGGRGGRPDRRVHRRGPGDGRLRFPARPGRHRLVHGPTTPHRRRVDGSRLRGLDGVQLPRLPDRGRDRRRAGGHLDRGVGHRRRGGRGAGRRPGRDDDPQAGRSGGPVAGADAFELMRRRRPDDVADATPAVYRSGRRRQPREGDVAAPTIARARA